MKVKQQQKKKIKNEKKAIIQFSMYISRSAKNHFFLQHLSCKAILLKTKTKIKKK